MHWFLIGLLTPALSSIGNFIDKVLIERFSTRGATVGVLALYSSLFSVLVLTMLAFVNPQVLNILPLNAAWLVVAGVIEITSVLLYLNAMKEDDASTLVPLFQTIPVFSVVLGFFILGEVLGLTQSLLIIGVVIGSMVLTFNIEGKGLSRIKWAPLLLMLGSSFSFALYDALFKYGALEEQFWTAVFWQHVGIALVGIGIYVCSGRLRGAFHRNVHTNGARVFSLNLLNEALYVLGVAAYSYALLLAPIALVATVTAYQPIFVFLIGLGLTLWFPKILSEDIRLKTIIQKVVGITIVVGCSALLAYWSL